MKILIIEDDQSLQQALLTKLGKEGFVVCSASNGKEGILKSVKEAPDLILLDLIMPEMTGQITLRHLKELPETREIPVIILTAVPEGVPQMLSKDGIFTKAEMFLEKDKTTLSQVVDNIKKILKI